MTPRNDPTLFDQARLLNMFPCTNDQSTEDLWSRVESARDRVNLFGLTRNYYATPPFCDMLADKASRVPVTIYTMDPHCESRKDRFRLEPQAAQWGDVDRYIRDIMNPLKHMPHIAIYTYNFPCSFAIEEIDNVCRVMLYGHGKRGTEGPIMVYGEGSDYYGYFSSQIRWLELLAAEDNPFWGARGICVRPYR